MAWPEPCLVLPQPGSIPLEDARNAAWRALLARAGAIVAAAGPALRPHLTLGGGSMLAWRYGHRESRDLDFFLPDAQLLGLLTPRLHDAIAALADGYEESSNVIRFAFAAQEVDFFVGAPVLARRPSATIDLTPGLPVPVEPVGEIMAKKLLYRGAAFTHRDVIDLAVVQALEPGELDDLPDRLGARALARLAKRLDDMEAGFADQAGIRVALRPAFATLAAAALPIAQAAVSRMQAALSRRAPR
jgi:hypothetical protein